MTDLECNSCGMFADKVQDISWFDGYTSAEIVVYCKKCDVDTTLRFTEPEIIESHQYKEEA